MKVIRITFKDGTIKDYEYIECFVIENWLKIFRKEGREYTFIAFPLSRIKTYLLTYKGDTE